MAQPLFSEFYLPEALGKQVQKAREEVDATDEDYLLNASESDLVTFFMPKFAAEPPQLGDPFIAESKETDIDVRRRPGYAVLGDEPVYAKGTRVEIHLPFTGDPSMFRCCPSSQLSGSPYAEIRKDRLIFTYETPGELNSEEIKGNFDRALGNVRTMVQYIHADCAKFNGALENQIRQIVAGRKARLLQSRQAVASIGLPMKRREDAAQTYAVPTVRRKPHIHMPIVKDKVFAPEPALAQEQYEHILSAIKSWAVSVERSPDAFMHMGEEHLRWQILVMLNSHYEGRATGETFNRQGKTDILIREGDRNVFIAECAFWEGEAYLLKKIDQVLDYLHWRDTKAAVIVFNRNKSFSDVLAQVEGIVKKHPSCKKALKTIGETEWRFLFGNKDDRNRELQLAVLLFDIPKPTA